MPVLNAYFQGFLGLQGPALAGKIISVLALFLQVYALACPREKTTKNLASIASLGWAASFFIAGANSAAFMASLSSFRQAVSARLIQAQHKTKVKWSIFFFSIGWLVGFVTYKDLWSLVPVLAGTCSVYAYFYCSNLAMRWMLVFSGQLWLLTYWNAGIYEGILSVALSTVAALVGIYRLSKKTSPLDA